MALKKVNNGNFQNLETYNPAEYVGKKSDFKIVDFKEHVGKNDSIVYTIDINGAQMQMWGSKVLDGTLLNAPLNTRIVVEYLGEAVPQGGGGRKYKNFDIYIDDGQEGEDEISLDAQPAQATATPAKKGNVPF